MTQGVSSNVQSLKLLILIGVILLLSASIRLYGLEIQSLWYDEIYSMNQSAPDLTINEVIQYSKQDQPPAFFLLLHFWFQFFGFNDFSGRLLAAIIGILGIVALFFLGKEVSSAKVGLIAAFIASLNFFHLYYSQEVRFYGLLFMSSCLSTLFFLRGIKLSLNSDYFFYTIFSVLMVYTHYFGMVVLCSHAIVFLWLALLSRPRLMTIWKPLLSGGLVFVSLIPWMPQIVKDNSITDFWIQSVSFPNFLFSFFYHYFESIPIAVSFGVLLLGCLYRLFTNKEFARKLVCREIFVVLSILVLCLSIPSLYSIIRIPIMVVRYTIIIVPLLFVILAVAVDSLAYPLKTAFLILFFCFSISTIFFEQRYYLFKKKEQIREVTQLALANASAKSVFISHYAWHFNYYFRVYGSSHRVLHPDNIDYKDVVSSADQIWLLQCHEDNFGTTAQQLTIIEESFSLQQQVVLIGARASLYSRKK